MARQQRDGDRHWAEPWAGWLAVAMALGVTLWRASPSPQWRDDLAVVRGLGFVPIGGEGVVSGAVVQVLALVPVGGRLLRAAAVGATAAALAAVAIYSLVRLALSLRDTPPGLRTYLAFGAAMLAVLSPPWQLESTVGGGASLGAALACFGVLLALRGVQDARVAAGLGALLALTTLESRSAGLAAICAVAVSVAVSGSGVPVRSAGAFALAATGALAVGLLPAFLRPLAGRAWLDLGFDLVRVSGIELATGTPSVSSPSAWSAALGPFACALAALGAGFGLLSASLRRVVLVLAVFAAADLALPGRGFESVASDPRAPLRLLGVAALAIGVAVGVATVVGALARAGIPYARPVSALLIAFTATLALVAAEESFYIAERRSHHAADVWTDEALASLPPRSLVLVGSEPVAWRLWAARVSRGSRPDVLVVPLPLVGRGSLARRLLALEPALEVSIRDMAVSGRPSEYGLSSAADLRPVFVEVDEGWDERLLEHVLPAGLWARFWPHAVGSSDRRAALDPARAAFERVALLASASGARDEATLAVLRRHGDEQVRLLSTVRDTRGARDLAAWFDQIWGERGPASVESRPALAGSAAALDARAAQR